MDLDFMNDRLYRIEEDEKFGFIERNGDIIIPPNYDYAREFHEGIAWVNNGGSKTIYDCEGGQWGTINENGEIIIDINLELSELQGFSEGFAWIKFGKNKYKDKWSLIDKEGNLIGKDTHDFQKAHAFQNGMAIVEQNGKKGFLDKDGTLIIPPKYDSLSFFEEGLAFVNIGAEEDYDGFLVGGKWGIINTNGAYIKDHVYDHVKGFFGEVAWVIKDLKDGKWGLINQEGTQIIDHDYDEVFSFYHEKALVRKDENYYFMDKSCNIITDVDDSVDKISNFDGKIGKAISNGKYGFISDKGDYIQQPIYQEVKDSENAAWVKLEDKWYIFNKQTYQILTPPEQYHHVDTFIGDQAHIWRKGNKCGMIDKNGTVIAEPKYGWVGFYYDNLVWVNIGGSIGYGGIRGGKFGLIDTQGNFVVEPKFDWIWDFWQGELLEFKLKDKKGYVNRRGEIVWIQK